MIPEITDRMGTYYRNRSGFYIDYFYQMAYDLGDTSLPLIDACKILYVAVERRKPRDGGGLGIHPIHPMYPVYRRNLTTSLTTTEGLRKNYDSLYSARIA